MNAPTGPGQFDGGGLFVVSRDGKESRQLAKTVRELRSSGQYVYRSLEFLRRIPGNDDEILVTGNLRSASGLGAGWSPVGPLETPGPWQPARGVQLAYGFPGTRVDGNDDFAWRKDDRDLLHGSLLH